MNPRVVRAGPERAWELTGVIARAMVDDPMVRWPLRPGADAETVRHSWVRLIEVFARAEALWETEGGGAAASWLGPEHVDAYPRSNGPPARTSAPTPTTTAPDMPPSGTGSRSISPRSRAGSLR